jgi:hypothetical protein
VIKDHPEEIRTIPGKQKEGTRNGYRKQKKANSKIKNN